MGAHRFLNTLQERNCEYGENIPEFVVKEYDSEKVKVYCDFRVSPLTEEDLLGDC